PHQHHLPPLPTRRSSDLHVSAGDASSPACVCFIGICPPSGHAVVDSVITCTAPRPRPPPRGPAIGGWPGGPDRGAPRCWPTADRSEEHTSELQSRGHLVC